ncbi:acyltransferase [Alsobacter metallidurans]|uniref:Acyltransferase n=1 Tax=Alsobacter metallidurans TaxID=340221 RepID=A0A917I9K1_9HYPH|nr:acyltransferase [Alsobacter metallidurans]GGH24911.1 acyltransferase [Alsobacter metallidurans]
MSGRLSNIQILRALAALFVVLSHAAHETFGMAEKLGLPPIMEVSNRWTAAVDVFFVMSGFILLSTSYDAFAQPGASLKFFMRRLVRAVPLYWLLTTLVLVGGFIAPRLLNVPITEPLHVLASYFFFPFERANGEMRPVLALGWTMNIEFFFYALLALCLALPRKWGVGLASAVLAGMVAAAHLPGAPASVSFWGGAMTLDFIVGFAIAIAFKAGVRVSADFALVVCAASVAAIFASSSADSFKLDWFVTISLPAAALVAMAVLAPQIPTNTRIARLGVLLGDACYSTYLLQPFILRPAAFAWTALVGAGVSLWVFVAAAGLAAMAGGLVCFLVFETPLTAALNRRLRAWESRREARPLRLQPAE